MNGDAFTKKYEVRDPETGEAIEDAFVMRPHEDGFALTCVIAYLRLCGLEDASMLRHIAMYKPDELLEALKSEMKPAIESVSGGPESLKDWSEIGSSGDGTVETLIGLAASLGLEPSTVIYKRTQRTEANREEAKVARKERDSLSAMRAYAREREGAVK